MSGTLEGSPFAQQRTPEGRLQHEWRYRVEPQVQDTKKYIYTPEAVYECVPPGTAWWRAFEFRTEYKPHWLLRWNTVPVQTLTDSQSFVTEAEAHEWCAQKVRCRAMQVQATDTARQARRQLPPSTEYRVDNDELRAMARRARRAPDDDL